MSATQQSDAIDQMRRIAELEAVVEAAVVWQKSFVHGRDITDEGYSVADEEAECALYEATTDFIDHAKAATALLDQQARAAELEAVVATLPKCNRLVDGVLVCDKPVTRDMEAWSRHPRLGNRITHVKILELRRDNKVFCNVHWGMMWMELPASALYDTREAAEAARDGQSQSS